MRTLPDEPSCVPARVGEYAGVVTSVDPDGDGLRVMPTIAPPYLIPFVPWTRRASDFDGGLGDVCDPCPLDANTEECSTPDPNDRDNDGVKLVRQLPSTSNADQADADDDVAMFVTLRLTQTLQVQVPASIYAIKTGN